MNQAFDTNSHAGVVLLRKASENFPPDAANASQLLVLVSFPEDENVLGTHWIRGLMGMRFVSNDVK
jgi:hypothetical protein